MSFTRFATMACALAIVCLASTDSHADLVSGPNMDPMADGLVFGGNDLFAFGGYGATGGVNFQNNSAARLTFAPVNGAGHGNSVPIDPASLPNGNIAVGDVLRYSLWTKNDPNDPVTGLPQVGPLLKFEFHNNQLDGASTQRQFDTEVDAGDFTSVIPTGDWTQFSYEYVVDAANFSDLSAVQEIRAVLFAGEFAGGTSAGGSYFIDNIAVEWFDDIDLANASPASVTNPAPVKAIPEPTALVVLGIAALACQRRRR